MQHVFHGQLTEAHNKRHLPHKFLVPPACTRLSLRLHFEPAQAGDARNMLTLTLFDPAGFRGAGHRGGNLHELYLAPDSATAGYIAGPLPAGTWIAQIDAHRVGAEEPCTYSLTVTVETAGGAVAEKTGVVAPPDFDRVLSSTPGWYRGDLHAHTRHSDGDWDEADLVAAARAERLDFVALTDHNTVSGLASFAGLGGDHLLTMGGLELTTFWGHAVCLGLSEWLDWRVDASGTAMANIARSLQSSGAHFAIAHPRSPGDPYCTGCRWLYPDMMPGPARCVEVWNGPWVPPGGAPSYNEEGLALWYQWLNAGFHLVATAGSDAHSLADYRNRPGFNVVYADDLSQSAILRGVAAGHLYLSSGPTLQFRASQAGERTAMMGDHLRVDSHAGDLCLEASCTLCPPDSLLRLVENGQVIDEVPVSGAAEHTWEQPANPGTWYLMELRDRHHEMLALTNPIFFTAGD